MGQTSTQTTTNSIPSAGGQESELRALLQRLAKNSAGQLGDLSGLANGQLQGPSQQDVELAQNTIGRTGDMAQRELQRIAGPLMAKIQESGQGRGGSLGSLDKILGQQEITGRLADILGGAQQQQGQALMNLPFQRAQTQMGANQLLFQMLTGAANPVLANALQERMSSGTSKTQTKTPVDWASLGKTVGAIGAAPFTGGASLAGIGIPGLGGGQQAPQLSPQTIQSLLPNPYTGRY